MFERIVERQRNFIYENDLNARFTFYYYVGLLKLNLI